MNPSYLCHVGSFPRVVFFPKWFWILKSGINLKSLRFEASSNRKHSARFDRLNEEILVLARTESTSMATGANFEGKKRFKYDPKSYGFVVVG